MNLFQKYILPPGGKLESFILNNILGVGKLLEEFEQKTKTFSKSQKENLEKIVEKNKSTIFGKTHNFSLSNWENIPIQTYQDLKPYIDKLQNNFFDSLTKQKPLSYAITSGTTSQPKLIPLTYSGILSQKKASDVWNFYLAISHGDLLSKVLVLNGGSKPKFQKNLPIKSYTEIVKERQPSYVKTRFIFPESLNFITDFEHRLLIASQIAVIYNPLTLISTNSVSVLRLLELFRENHSQILRDTENGYYFQTSKKLPRIKNKTKLLEKINSVSNPLNSVKLLGTWLGGTQYLFIDQLSEKGINCNKRDLGYLATEGRFSIPIKDDSSLGILNPFGNYYEFLTTDKKDLVPLNELEVGKEYNIILTTENGLYRYDIQDIIEFYGYHNTAPIIKFKRKDSGFSSLIGEKLHENHVLELFKRSGIQTGFLIAKSSPAHYDLIIPETPRKYNLRDLDFLLQEINSEYKQKRENNRLKSLCLSVLPLSRFEELDKKYNPNKTHDRFKRKYLIPVYS